MSRLGPSLVASSLLLVALAAPLAAYADPSAAQRAEAQALFDDARKLMADRRFGDACPKLEASQRIDPGLGTLLNLAECQAQTGKTASAWANFLEAAYEAKAAGQTNRENAARAKASKLEARLSRVKILASDPATMELSRDGVVLPPSLLGTAVPVDPGEHVLRATAAGKKPWETTFTVKDDGQPITISVPRLEVEEPAAPPPLVPPPVVAPPPPVVAPPPAPVVVLPPPEPLPPPAPPEDGGRTGRRVGGIVLGVVGLGGVVVGSVFGLKAKQQYKDSLADCNKPPDQNTCVSAGVTLRNTARRSGDISTVGFIAGGAVLAGGIGLLVSSIPGKPAASAGVSVTVAMDPGRSAALGLKGAF